MNLITFTKSLGQQCEVFTMKPDGSQVIRLMVERNSPIDWQPPILEDRTFLICP
jgi:hypothetical protein